MSLSWSAPGNDSNSGTLASGSEFRIQYSTNASVSWSTTSAQVSLSTSGVTSGSAHVYAQLGLTGGGTYYFRVWTKDESNNWSAISNGQQTGAVGLDGSVSGHFIVRVAGSVGGDVSLTWLFRAMTVLRGLLHLTICVGALRWHCLGIDCVQL